MALGVTAYSEAPFGAEASDVIAYPLGTNVTSQIGNFTTQANADVSVTGNSVTSSTGQAVASSLAVVPVSGINANIVTGNEDAFTDITVEVTSAGQLTVFNQIFEQDTLTAFGEDPFATQSSSTFNPVNVIVDLNTPVDVTGIQLTTSIGNEDAFTDVVVEVTGQSLSTAIGDVDAIAIYEVTGISLSANIGSVTVQANADVNITGINLTAVIGQTRITAWAEVDTGIDVVWTPVDLAA